MVCEQKKSMGIRLKDLSKLGYRDNVARSLVVDIVGQYCEHDTEDPIAMTLSTSLEAGRTPFADYNSERVYSL